MAPWNDAEADSDSGDELLDWLWDLPERYDVGIDDDPLASGAVPAVGRVGVRKHLRHSGDAAVSSPPTELSDDRPTEAVDVIEPFDGADPYQYDTVLAPVAAGRHRSKRFKARDLATAAAVLLVVALGGFMGFKLFSGGSSKAPKPSDLAVNTPPATTATTFDQGGFVPADTTSTTVPPSTTVVTPPTVPAAVTVAGVTTTTVRRTTTGTTRPTAPPTTRRTTPPPTAPPPTNPPPTTPPSTTPPSTTPPSTTPPSTTPPSTTPPSTTPPSTTPPSTTPPSTSPPTS